MKNVNALIQLLEDPDEKVFTQIEAELLRYGQDIMPQLNEARDQAAYSLQQNRIEGIIRHISLAETQGLIEHWVNNDMGNLFKGAFLVARHQYPDLDITPITAEVNKLQKDAWLEMNNSLTALEKVRILNYIFFEVYGFAGNKSDPYDPKNSFINDVLERKLGNPLSLSILYSIVAQQLGMPVYGVNLPEHFALAYLDEEGPMHAATVKPNILFYINAFNNGSVFTKKEITKYIRQLKLRSDSKHFFPCTNLQVVRRLIYNLIGAYDFLKEKEKADSYRRLLKSLAMTK